MSGAIKGFMPLTPKERAWLDRAHHDSGTRFSGCRWDRAPAIFQRLLSAGYGEKRFQRGFGRGRVVARFLINDRGRDALNMASGRFAVVTPEAHP